MLGKLFRKKKVAPAQENAQEKQSANGELEKAVTKGPANRDIQDISYQGEELHLEDVAESDLTETDIMFLSQVEALGIDAGVVDTSVLEFEHTDEEIRAYEEKTKAEREQEAPEKDAGSQEAANEQTQELNELVVNDIPDEVKQILQSIKSNAGNLLSAKYTSETPFSFTQSTVTSLKDIDELLKEVSMRAFGIDIEQVDEDNANEASDDKIDSDVVKNEKSAPYSLSDNLILESVNALLGVPSIIEPLTNNDDDHNVDNDASAHWKFVCSMMVHSNHKDFQAIIECINNVDIKAFTNSVAPLGEMLFANSLVAEKSGVLIGKLPTSSMFDREWFKLFSMDIANQCFSTWPHSVDGKHLAVWPYHEALEPEERQAIIAAINELYPSSLTSLAICTGKGISDVRNNTKLHEDERQQVAFAIEKKWKSLMGSLYLRSIEKEVDHGVV